MLFLLADVLVLPSDLLVLALYFIEQHRIDQVVANRMRTLLRVVHREWRRDLLDLFSDETVLLYSLWIDFWLVASSLAAASSAS